LKKLIQLTYEQLKLIQHLSITIDTEEGTYHFIPYCLFHRGLKAHPDMTCSLLEEADIPAEIAAQMLTILHKRDRPDEGTPPSAGGLDAVMDRHRNYMIRVDITGGQGHSPAGGSATAATDDLISVSVNGVPTRGRIMVGYNGASVFVPEETFPSPDNGYTLSHQPVFLDGTVVSVPPSTEDMTSVPLTGVPALDDHNERVLSSMQEIDRIVGQGEPIPAETEQRLYDWFVQRRIPAVLMRRCAYLLGIPPPNDETGHSRSFAP
jgi:hypothetical protein